MSKKAHIYLIIINDTFEQYVGQSVNVDRRVRSHEYSNQLVDKKMREHGYTWTILEETDTDHVDEREKYYIDLFTTRTKYNCGGLNIDEGGGQTHEWDEEYRQKMSVAVRNSYTDERRQALSDTLKEKMNTKEVRDKARLAQTSRKPIVQLDKDKFIIREWDSINQAEEELNLTGIKSACISKGKKKIKDGFWMYLDDYNKMLYP